MNKYYKIAIVCGFFILSVVSFLVIIVKKPTITASNSVNDNSNYRIETKEIDFPFLQTFNVNTDRIKYFSIMLGDDSLTKYDFNIIIKNQNRDTVYEHFYEDYGSNIIIVNPETRIGDKLSLTIECDKCKNDVKFQLFSGEEDSLLITGTTERYNYWFLLYPVILFIISGALGLLFFEGKRNEKNTRK